MFIETKGLNNINEELCSDVSDYITSSLDPIKKTRPKSTK